MKRQLCGLIAISSICNLTNTVALAQPTQSNNLYYTYKGQRIPLQQRQDLIAVAFKPTVTTRGSAPILRLEQDLASGFRSSTPLEVTPLGTNYALVSLPKGVSSSGVEQRIQQQSYVQGTLPVLTRNNSQDVIGLPNEIIVTFKPNLSDSDKQSILKKNNLTVIRKLRFTPNHYLVRTNNPGTAVLGIANQLTQVQGINSATPNFIQTISKFPHPGNFKLFNTPARNKQNKSNNLYPNSNYLGLQWHLNSTPLKQCLDNKASDFDSLQSCLNQPVAAKASVNRTDLRVIEAWKNTTNKGRDVVVAVIDSTIQWNHPDLKNSLHTITSQDKCPGEIHGWDFSEQVSGDVSDPCSIGDADTRLNNLELTILNRRFRDTFLLTDAKFLARYPRISQMAKYAYPDKSENEIAQLIRDEFRQSLGGEFHGTLVSGVIAAKPDGNQGVLGVAPNAKIMPIRVFGLNGSFSITGYIESIGYAASRGADVINLSLGTYLPSDAESQVYEQVLKANPKLVIVAASGNSSDISVSFPSGYPGVISVGASNILGNRAPYSNFGKGLSLVAPGGDTYSPPGVAGGIVTTGGTWMEAFWQGIPTPTSRWGDVVDMRGKYWSVQGTSFSSPAVAGVVALIKGEDTNRQLNREQITNILKSTATYEGLALSDEEMKLYNSQMKQGSMAVSDKQYFFGSGLVNAEAAINATKKQLASK
jgi:subtilisin family serine protease